MKQVNVVPEIVKDQRDFAAQLAEAKDFFADENLPESPRYLLEDNPYADKDGLVEFIFGAPLEEDPVVMANLVEQKKYLIAMTSIVTDYVNRYAEAYGEEYKTDVELWTLAMSKIPLMGPSKIDEQTYSRHIRGIEIATDFIDFILEIVASEGSSALDSFSKFLEKQGDALRFGVENNKDYYRTITIGVALEVFKVGEQVVYVPKLKQYRVNFTRENSKFSSACVSYEMVDIHFEYRYAANVFDYEALEDPEIKKDLDDFIQKQRKAQIDEASTFFDDDFPVKDPEV
ncbi:hypothetical protein OO006_08460 [Prosthecochloris sp. SCSIO W1101]|uniref:hypothetical protein n=1 Tax=Prosthecochloris sp. SCSIO W1101 TaxID=2992242 RepID=UPI00223E1E88|nr:hypothetical protein [Prosthecochloris sp. SCSIO W1101]UZJ40398.1 hypothetical protein OO006_08460 [Prosthecochloris sp. SCSIO W1101]